MNKDELIEQLGKGDLDITFIKKTTGSERVLKATANVPDEIKKSAETEKRIKPEGLVTVFDKEAKEWRSLYLDSIVNVKPSDSQFGLLQEQK